MVIKSIYVDNFKALNDFQMDFTPFTVIVGNNMSGKSTVLQVLDFMASLAREDAGVILERRGWKVSDVKSRMRNLQRIIISCDLEFESKEGPQSVHWGIQILAHTQKNMMELEQETVWKQRENQKEILLFYSKEKGGFIQNGEGKQQVIIPRLQSDSSVLKIMNFGEFPVLQSLKDFWMNSDSFELLSPEKMRLSSRGDVDTIGNAGEKLPSFVKSMNSEQKKRFAEKINQVLDGKIAGVEAQTKGKPGWTHLVAEETYKNKTLIIESKNMSDGILRLLAFLAICEIDKNGVMLLDEIENGINLDYAEKIIRILEKNCEEKKNQLIVTTHSPIFLDYVDKENIRYMYRDGETGNCRSSSLTKNRELNDKMQYLYPGELFMNMSNNDIIKALMMERDA